MSLKVGIAETIIEKKRKLKRQTGLSSGTGLNGGMGNHGGGSGNGGDDNNKNSEFLRDVEPYSSDKFRIAMWFLLLVVMMTFGGLIGAYIVLATNGALEWKPFVLPFQVWVSTIFILTSSITYIIAQRALSSENQTKAKNYLLTTAILGSMFISSQLLAWVELVHRGVYVSSNPYAGFFYILTAVHALHVIGGICALGYIVLRTWNKTFSHKELTKRKSISNAVGWYWHFMGGLWVVLFLLLGFWK